MFFPDGEGNPQIIDLNENDSSTRISLAHDNPDSKIMMWLYNKFGKKASRKLKVFKQIFFYRKNPSTPIPLKATGSKSRENFTLTDSYDGSKKTKIIIHGWKNK